MSKVAARTAVFRLTSAQLSVADLALRFARSPSCVMSEKDRERLESVIRKCEAAMASLRVRP